MVNVIVVIAVVLLVLVVFVVMVARYRRPPQLARRLRSTSFSRQRSDAIKRAANADVTDILQADRYPGADAAPGQESEL